jgi:diguanylate cyclase (GGDEF)-like protein
MELRDQLLKVKEKIIGLLNQEDMESDIFLEQLKHLEETHHVRVYALVLLMLTHLNFDEMEAKNHIIKILDHRKEMKEKVKRDIGLRVTALDYFLNIEKKLDNPKVIEFSLYEKTERSALTDWLTGLHNQRFFRIYFQKELQRAKRYKFHLSLFLLDIDDFKNINDQYGHLFGDVVLKEAAKIIQRNVRDSDVTFRYGGEEFAVILPETTRMGAYIVAERIRKGVEEWFQEVELVGKQLRLTVSGGISVFPDDALSFTDMIEKADKALYHSKAEGKNRISIFHMERRAFVRFDIASAELRVNIVRADEENFGEACSMKNLSQSGILFESNEPFDIGEKVKIMIKSVKVKKRLTVVGRVVRLEEVLYSDGRKAYDVGMAFILDSDLHEKAFIDLFSNLKTGYEQSKQDILKQEE